MLPDKDTLSLERKLARMRMLAQERPYRTQERDPMPERKLALSDAEVQEAQQQELARERQLAREREERLQSLEQEKAQRTDFSQERDQRLQERTRELDQKRATLLRDYHPGNGTAPTATERGRGAQAPLPPHSPYDRLMAQKREVDQERARLNQERKQERDRAFLLEAPQARGRRPLTYEYADYYDEQEPQVQWQGGTEGLRELIHNNKLLIAAIAVFVMAILIMTVIRVTGGVV
jgi:hypothetical protein